MYVYRGIEQPSSDMLVIRKWMGLGCIKIPQARMYMYMYMYNTSDL